MVCVLVPFEAENFKLPSLWIRRRPKRGNFHIRVDLEDRYDSTSAAGIIQASRRGRGPRGFLQGLLSKGDFARLARAWRSDKSIDLGYPVCPHLQPNGAVFGCQLSGAPHARATSV